MMFFWILATSCWLDPTTLTDYMKYPKRMQSACAQTEVKRNLGLRISQIRMEEGVSQRQLALRLGLDRVTLNQIESGKGNPTLETLIRIAGGLNRSVEDLFLE